MAVANANRMRILGRARGIGPARTGYTGFLVALLVMALVIVLLGIILPVLAAVLLFLCFVVVAPLVYIGRSGDAGERRARWVRWMRRNAAFQIARRARGRPLYLSTGIVDDGLGNTWPSAIAIVHARLFVMDRGLIAVLPWEAVRTWRAEEAGVAVAQEVSADGTPVGVAPVTTAGGIVFEVDDVAHPVWRFETGDPSVIARWREILRRIDDAGSREGR